MAAAEARAYREHPWATIDQFLERATDLTVSDTRLRDLQIKTTEPELMSRVLTDRVIGALERARCLVNDPAASLRIWVGAPNLRIHLASVIDDDRQDDRSVVLQKVVDLGRGAGSLVSISVPNRSITEDGGLKSDCRGTANDASAERTCHGLPVSASTWTSVAVNVTSSFAWSGFAGLRVSTSPSRHPAAAGILMTVQNGLLSVVETGTADYGVSTT